MIIIALNLRCSVLAPYVLWHEFIATVVYLRYCLALHIHLSSCDHDHQQIHCVVANAVAATSMTANAATTAKYLVFIVLPNSTNVLFIYIKLSILLLFDLFFSEVQQSRKGMEH